MVYPQLFNLGESQNDGPTAQHDSTSVSKFKVLYYRVVMLALAIALLKITGGY